MTDRMTTRWWLIRHAPVPNPLGLIHGSGDPDADTGDRATAMALAAILPEDAVWLTSPLRRTRQTAQMLRPSVDPLTEPALAEQDFGRWEGLSHDEIAARQPEEAERFWRDPARNAPPGGESFAAVMERVADALRRWTGEEAGGDRIAVIHGGSIRASLALALDLTPGAALRLRVDHWSLTRLDCHAGTSWSVGGVNLRPGTFSGGGR
ncbi:histidine phosphatase family protein [Azospirillum doebereinerae]|uniref:Histidine phosphatase family protein n=1 Tax=Azospirillum doebereinerae TaxID=92933 RepID=A0A433JD00_9PROT|nr:histidine phosphatase family protein [Azospirillum doebereinerae]RUQ74587.1 histidine phosphatase family protein [Azospirillum doebereinerae]